MGKKAVIFLAEGFEEIEAVTTIDVLRRAGVDVVIAGLGDDPVRGSRGIRVVRDVPVQAVRQEFDAYILPGGAAGAENLARSPEVTDLLRNAFRAGKIIAAICAAPAVVLSPLGLLSGKTATCFPGMEKDFPSSAVPGAGPVVIDGNLITSRGPATALFFALKIAEELSGKEISDKVRRATLADTL